MQWPVGRCLVPMTFANRLGKAVSKSEIMIVRRPTVEGGPRPFREVLSLFADMLFKPGQTGEGVIPLTPAGFERGTAVHFMTIAGSRDGARSMATSNA